MDYPVLHHGNSVGNCSISDLGLYWELECVCSVCSDQVERIYSGMKRIGVLERQGDRLYCRRRVSKSSCPELPPKSGRLTLSPQPDREPWKGTLLGQPMEGYRENEMLLFPYAPDQPCPCEMLICFFEIRDGFWRLPANPEWISS